MSLSGEGLERLSVPRRLILWRLAVEISGWQRKKKERKKKKQIGDEAMNGCFGVYKLLCFSGEDFPFGVLESGVRSSDIYYTHFYILYLS